MSDDREIVRKEETHCLLIAIGKFENEHPDNKNTNAKKWPYILNTYNNLIKHAKRCKQARTLRVRYQKLVSMFSSGNMGFLQKFCYAEDIELLKQMITMSSEKNSSYMNENGLDTPNSMLDKMNNVVDDENSTNDDEQPLDTIKVLPRSSYLSTKKDQTATSSTETASLSNSNISYASGNKSNMNNSGKKLSILYGACMMDDDDALTTSDISRDLEIAQMKETIKTLQETVAKLEEHFEVLTQRMDGLEKK